MNHVVYDTNVASLAVRGRMPAALGARLFGAVEVLTFVTVGELVKWSQLRSWGHRQRGALDAWLGQRPVIDSTRGGLADLGSARGLDPGERCAGLRE